MHSLVFSRETKARGTNRVSRITVWEVTFGLFHVTTRTTTQEEDVTKRQWKTIITNILAALNLVQDNLQATLKRRYERVDKYNSSRCETPL